MNDLYTQDRMARNASDYEGCGIGEGRYDVGAERREKLKALQLPFALLIFMAVYMVALVLLTIDTVNNITGSEKYVVEADKNKDHVEIQLPDGSYREVAINSKEVSYGEVTIYYNVEEDKVYIPWPMGIWIFVYAFGLLVIFLLLFWVKNILFKKKHAVERKREHSYKDY